MSGSATSAERRRQVQLPWSKAVSIAYNSIKIRFWRSMITAAGIFLGIAFYASVSMAGVFSDIQKETIAYKAAEIKAGRLKPTADDVRLVNSAPATAKEDLANTTRLRWLSIMALLVCTVGITNAMLMAVTERYKEIGTMKCLGALDSLIVKLFFLESGFLGFLASVLGYAAGWLVISLVHLVTDGFEAFGAHYWLSSLQMLGMSAAVGTILTLLATIAPAIRAAQMPPAAALRVEI